MRFKYSVCHVDKADIEYRDETLSTEEVKEKALNYPWEEELQKMKTMNPDELQYNPSLDFKNQLDEYSFCLTAEGEPEDYSFSIWYKRRKVKKVFFGLLGEKDAFEVIDKWFSKEDSFKLLDKFLKREYQTIEREMSET